MDDLTTFHPRAADHEPHDASSFGAYRLGRRRFLLALGASAGAGALASLSGAAPASALAAGASRFVPLPQAVRVIDTRQAERYEFQRFADNHVRIPIAGSHGVPAGATAIVATVTAVNLSGPNWLTVVPAGAPITDLVNQNRLVSALNMLFYIEATANMTQVKLAGGGVDLFSLSPCHMILDVLGYYEPVNGSVRDGRFVSLGIAQRAVDTRDTIGYVGSGETLLVDLTDLVPDEASSVMVNLTATETTGPGYFTVYPAASAGVPEASSLNVNGPDSTRASAALVPIATQGGRRHIKVFALTAAKLIVDVVGYFTSERSALSQSGLFVPVDPIRIFDTREGGGRLWPGWTIVGAIPGDGATGGSAAVVNLTGANSRAPGFLTISGARLPAPGTSNLNFSAGGQVVANHAITPITAGHGYQVFSSGGADVIVDYLGYYTGVPQTPVLGPPVNPPPPPIGPEWFLMVPAIGLESTVRAGNSIVVTNSGYSWHWTGTGFMGEDAHVAMFAHRTTHGGAYRNIHLLGTGDQMILATLDGREYIYEVVRRDLTDYRTANILAATQHVPGPTLSLIACTQPNFQPTSTAWRIVVTGALVGWRQLY
jgi:hypothetical protein